VIVTLDVRFAGAYLAGADVITDKMLYVSAVACANALNSEEVSQGRTFPRINRIREVSHAVACAVIRSAMEDGIAPKITPRVLKEGLENHVGRKMYFPKYVPLIDPRHV
jgi:malate dehydrogenase (oxaloacetate-decarboxylating)(NADP+)